jgi:transposase
MILFEKYGQHQPLNRQSERYAREGVDLSLSTLADQVGACAVVLRPLYDLIRGHVLAAFISRKEEIDQMLARLQALSDDQFG